MKQIESKANEVAQQLCATYNPYKTQATEKRIEGSDLIVYERYGILYTIEALNNGYIETATKDFIAGYKDRMAGYYDKWYRYNHSDNGAAYDEGVKYAISQDKCILDMHIIECNA